MLPHSFPGSLHAPLDSCFTLFGFLWAPPATVSVSQRMWQPGFSPLAVFSKMSVSFPLCVTAGEIDWLVHDQPNGEHSFVHIAWLFFFFSSSSQSAVCEAAAPAHAILHKQDLQSWERKLGHCRGAQHFGCTEKPFFFPHALSTVFADSFRRRAESVTSRSAWAGRG